MPAQVSLSVAGPFWGGPGNYGPEPTQFDPAIDSAYDALVLADLPAYGSYWKFDEANFVNPVDRGVPNLPLSVVNNGISGATFAWRNYIGPIVSAPSNIAFRLSFGIGLAAPTGRPEYAFPSRAPYSLEVWVYPLGNSGRNRIFSRGTNDLLHGYGVDLNNDLTLSGWRMTEGVADTATSSDALVPRRWNHVVTTYDGTTISLYVNGVPSGSVASSQDLVATGPNNTFKAQLGLGNIVSNVGTGLSAYYARPAVYSSPLGPERVLAHFGGGVATTWSPDLTPLSLPITLGRTATLPRLNLPLLDSTTTVAGPDTTPTPGGAIAGGVSPTVLVPVPVGGGLGSGVGPTITVPVPQGGATAGGVAPTATTVVPQGGGVGQGVAPTARVPVPQGGATAGGLAPLPQTSLTSSGATAGGLGPTARVPVSPGGAVAGGVAPTETTSVSETPTPGGATAGGFGPTATTTLTLSGATAGGSAPTATTSVSQGGAVAAGLGATVRVNLTIGGATAGGFSPTDSTGISETPVPGGALAGGFGPTASVSTPVGGALAGGFAPLSTQTPSPGGALGGGLGPTARVTLASGGATAGGFSPSDGSAPSGPTVLEDPNHFILLHA